MSFWEYTAEIIKLEYGQGEQWSVLASPHGEMKLAKRLNEFGNSEWELVSIMPALDEHGIPTVTPALLAVFKKRKKGRDNPIQL